MRYFNRDISWLSFNYRVLLEAENERLPIYERVKFLSIHASNLEEFYKIRVAEHRGVILKKKHKEEDFEDSEKILNEINIEVTRQQSEFDRIFQLSILPELERQGIILYKNDRVIDSHKNFISEYFNEEVFPYMEPVLILKDEIRFFVRDNRIYIVIRLIKKDTGGTYYSILKIPFTKTPRFVSLPSLGGKHYFMFVDDIITANLHKIYPGFTIDCSYSVKISRDADIFIDEEQKKEDNLVEIIIKKVKKRKIGDLSRFVYDRNMPEEFLDYLAESLDIRREDMIPDSRHLNMQDLIKLPNPVGETLLSKTMSTLPVPALDRVYRISEAVKEKDIFLFYPYHSFDYFLRLLSEAAREPKVDSIKITQYRVAEHSEVIESLIHAAKNGKKVTVFVELKARFDEENNLQMAERMKQAGIKIIYSLQGLKVHAKFALITEKPGLGRRNGKSYAYLSTGNFNEKTAKLYSDMSILTSQKYLTEEIERVFDILQGHLPDYKFKHLLVSQFNLVPSLKAMIQREIDHVRQGKEGRITLKMNGLQDDLMIEELYQASESGVKIDLIIRGICCAVPNQTFSKNIRITRIVDRYLEHARVWYFYNEGKEDVYLTSADWMKRNLYRRIETAFPVSDKIIKQQIIDILNIQLNDNTSACFIDEHLNNIFKYNNAQGNIQAQQATYKYLGDLVEGTKN